MDITPVGVGYLSSIRSWQIKNGGFKRLPPRSFDVKLSNWVQFCRTQYRLGGLDPWTSSALKELGIPLEFAVHGIQPMPRVYTTSAVAVERIRASANLAGHQASWQSDALVTTWLAEMRVLAEKRPNCPLLKDLQEMIPAVYDREIAPGAGLKAVAPSLRRGTDAMLTQILDFFEANSRLPSVRAAGDKERQLASWLIRFEHKLMGRKAASSKREDEQQMLGAAVTRLLAAAKFKQRREEWHWWSLCALNVLSDPAVGNNWLLRIYKPTVELWETKLHVDRHISWAQQTSTAAKEMGVAQEWQVAKAISAAMDYVAAGIYAWRATNVQASISTRDRQIEDEHDS